MQQRKGKIILIYLILLASVGSINNINIYNLNYFEIKNIFVSGLQNNDNLLITEEINKLNLENIFFINKLNVKNVIEQNNLIENYKIFKKYPSTLEIKINKTSFLAKIKKNDNEFIIGSNGKYLKNTFETSQLPYIFGNPEIREFIEFKKKIDESNIAYEQIKNLYFFKSKRWDLELKNNIIIKLSKDDLKNSLNNSYEFLKNNNFKNIKIIDARIKNQIILYDRRI